MGTKKYADVKFDKYHYEPAGEASVLQGYKGGREPRGAVTGGNGSYVVPGAPPQVLVGGVDNDRGRRFSQNIYRQMKDAGVERMSRKRAEKVVSRLLNGDGKVIYEGGEYIVENLEELI